MSLPPVRRKTKLAHNEPEAEVRVVAAPRVAAQNRKVRGRLAFTDLGSILQNFISAEHFGLIFYLKFLAKDEKYK
jgi:hypothetical protein